MGLALLIVDVQAGAVARGPYEGDLVLANIERLVDSCRANAVEVIYVQHDGLPGEEEEPGTPGWEIYDGIAPRPLERVIRKTSNSAFRGTDLRAHLEERGVQTLIVVGIQTEYCVDTTVRVAFEHGFDVLLPEMTNTTFDRGELSARQIHDHYHREIFDGRFGGVVSMDRALDLIGDAGATKS